MRDIHTSKPDEGASLSRRNFISVAAAGGVAATSPVAALAEVSSKTGRLPPSGELPIEHFVRLSAEMSAVLNEYLDGGFYACVYPENVRNGSHDLNGMVILKSIQADAYRPPLEKRFEMALKSLREVLQEMHPDANCVRQQISVSDEPGDFFVWMGVHREKGGAA